MKGIESIASKGHGGVDDGYDEAGLKNAFSGLEIMEAKIEQDATRFWRRTRNTAVFLRMMNTCVLGNVGGKLV